MRTRLLILYFTLLAAAPLCAYDACVGGIYYNLAGDSAQVTFAPSSATEHQNLYTGSITIPDEITYNQKTYRVTEIGQSAFAYCIDLTSVIMGNNIHRIGLFAFNQCTSLAWVDLSDNITAIDAFAFYHCEALPAIDLPTSLQSIANSAFAGCEMLTQVNVPHSVTTIGQGVWASCSSIASIQVDTPNPIYHSADNCIIHTASNELIAGCRNSTIPTHVTSIGNEAFAGCTTLKQMIIPDNVTAIGAYAFATCSGLTTLIISNSVTHIGGSAFAGCANVSVLNIPSMVQTIGASAFAACNSLKTISIPVTVDSIGAGAFAGCTSLERLSMPAANATYHSINNCIINTAKKELIVGCKRSVLPNDGSIKHIGNEAFAGCAQLASLTLPDSLTTIGDYAFSGCETLQHITIPSSTQSLGTRAFADCIGLKDIHIDATTPPTIEANVFEGLPNNVPIIVPCTSLPDYQAIPTWKALPNLTGTFAYTFDVTTADNTQGKVTITQQPTCANNATAIFEATANEGFVFSTWNDGNTENPRTVVIDGDVTYTASFVKVGAIPVTGVLLDSTTLLLDNGKAHYLTATVLPENASNKNIRWESDQPDIAIVENGWVIALSSGTANITVTTEEGNYTQTCSVTVKTTLATVVDGGHSSKLISVRKVLEHGTLYIIRTNPQTGKEEKYTIDGIKIY